MNDEKDTIEQPVRYGPWLPTKALANRLGAKSYFNGIVCLRGHMSPRTASSANCIACMYEDRVRKLADPVNAEKNREYHREYRRQRRNVDPEFLERNRAADRKSGKQPHVRERKNARRKQRRAEDPEYREHINELHRPSKQRWKKNNREVVKAYRNNRRALMRDAEGTHTADDIRSIHEQQEHKCAVCGEDTSEEYHVDHVVPISRGGSNWPDNLQILCPLCNTRKGAKTQEEFLLYLAAATITNP